MIRRGVDAAVPTALALGCGVAIVGYLRTMLEPAAAWSGPLVAVALCVATAWLVRLAPAGLPRIAAAAVAVLAAVLAATGLRTGRWPVQEDVGGPDGYLGASGYLRETGLALGEMARAWVQVLYPAEAAAEPDAVAIVRLVGLLLALAAALALIAFRSPVPAILAVATAAAVASLFIGFEPVWPHALGLAALGLALLALVGGEAHGRGLRTALGSGALLALVALLAFAGPLAVGGAAWGWKDWTVDEPDPVGVGFVWEQSLQSLAFQGKEVVVLEVEGRDAGYLRVGVLEGFDAVRWRTAGAASDAAAEGSFPLPAASVAPAARVGERPVRVVEVRNVALATQALPLPGGTIAVRGLPEGVLPAEVASTGSVGLAGPLPVGAVYAAEVVRVPATPELLDADLLGAATDPGPGVDGAFADDPVVGRYADRDGVAPWSDGAEQRAEAGPEPGPEDGRIGGPFDQRALADARPPRMDGPAPAPAAALVSVAGIAFPAFGAPEREREVQRLLAERIEEGGVAAGALSGWRSAYRVAREVTREAETPYQAAVLLEAWFQREFEYDEGASYATGAPIGPLPQFVLSTARSGHCQYFAGSMAALLRLHGIPARVAVGFTQGEVDGDRSLITNRDAHAWVEVRFPYAGWVAFEPTPTRSLPLPSSSTSESFAQGASGAGTALSGLIGARGPSLTEGPNRGSVDAGAGSRGAAAAPADEDGLLGTAARAAGLGAIAVVALAIAGWLVKRRRSARAYAEADPGAGAVALRDAVAAWLADQGAGTRDADAGDVALALRRLYGIDAGAWSGTLERARYAPPDEARLALRDARRETRALVGLVRGRVGRRERLRGALRPPRRPGRRRA